MSGPLESLKVVEMSALGPVPLVGQLLADLGAQVIIIDRRSAQPDITDVNRRGKQSVALNLKDQAGLVVARRLIADTDIVLEGFRPGVMEKLGLGPDELQALKPELIIGRMTGWGQHGPLSRDAGHDINYLALTGALHAIGKNGQPPMPPLNLAADYGGGAMFLMMGVLSALFERGISGKGQVVDAAMVDGVPAMMGLIHTAFARGEWVNRRESNMLDGGAPYYRCYETSDKKYIAVGAIEPQFFKTLVSLAGLPDSDIEIQNDRSQWSDMHARYEAHFKLKTRDQWEQIFCGTDACVSPVLNFDEVSAHTHNKERGVFISPDGVLQSAPAPRFNRTTTASPAAPIAAGSSTEEVLGTLGYTHEELQRMKVGGVIT